MRAPHFVGAIDPRNVTRVARHCVKWEGDRPRFGSHRIGLTVVVLAVIVLSLGFVPTASASPAGGNSVVDASSAPTEGMLDPVRPILSQRSGQQTGSDGTQGGDSSSSDGKDSGSDSADSDDSGGSDSGGQARDSDGSQDDSSSDKSDSSGANDGATGSDSTDGQESDSSTQDSSDSNSGQDGSQDSSDNGNSGESDSSGQNDDGNDGDSSDSQNSDESSRSDESNDDGTEESGASGKSGDQENNGASDKSNGSNDSSDSEQSGNSNNAGDSGNNGESANSGESDDDESSGESTSSGDSSDSSTDDDDDDGDSTGGTDDDSEDDQDGSNGSPDASSSDSSNDDSEEDDSSDSDDKSNEQGNDEEAGNDGNGEAPGKSDQSNGDNDKKSDNAAEAAGDENGKAGENGRAVGLGDGHPGNGVGPPTDRGRGAGKFTVSGLMVAGEAPPVPGPGRPDMDGGLGPNVSAETDTVDVVVENATAGSSVSINVSTEETRDDDVAFDSVNLDVNTSGDITLNITATREPLPGSPAFYPGDNSDLVSHIRLEHSISNDEVSNVSFTFRMSKDRLQAVDADLEDITLYRYDDGTWTALPTKPIAETSTHYIFSVRSPGLSEFAVGVQRPDFTLWYVDTPTQSIASGETVEVNGRVTNDGGADGVFTAHLVLNGRTVATNTLTVAGGGTRQTTFRVALNRSGEYEVTINNASGGSVTVHARAARTQGQLEAAESGLDSTEWIGSISSESVLDWATKLVSDVSVAPIRQVNSVFR